MAKCFLYLSCFSGFLSVAIGAFAAHGLKNKLSEYSIGVFQTGVQYQFYHALALGLVGLLAITHPHPFTKYAGYAFLIGTIIFSGSLYTLAISGQKFWGAITPIGGLSFLIGWALLAFSVSKSNF